MLKIKKKKWSVVLIAFSYTKQVSVPFPCLCRGTSCRKHAHRRKDKEKKKGQETQWACLTLLKWLLSFCSFYLYSLVHVQKPIFTTTRSPVGQCTGSPPLCFWSPLLTSSVVNRRPRIRGGEGVVREIMRRVLWSPHRREFIFFV